MNNTPAHTLFAILLCRGISNIGKFSVYKLILFPSFDLQQNVLGYGYFICNEPPNFQIDNQLERFVSYDMEYAIS